MNANDARAAARTIITSAPWAREVHTAPDNPRGLDEDATRSPNGLAAATERHGRELGALLVRELTNHGSAPDGHRCRAAAATFLLTPLDDRDEALAALLLALHGEFPAAVGGAA